MVEESIIWEPVTIQTVDDLVNFEDQYCELDASKGMVWMNGEFEPYDFHDGPLSFLTRHNFKLCSQNTNNAQQLVFESIGCTRLEAIVICGFLDFVSPVFRLDLYKEGTPPIAAELVRLLDQALDNLPPSACQLYRACKDDRIEFKVGEIFKPGYPLTTTSDPSWEDKSTDRYVINPLPSESTSGRDISAVFNKANECQNTFLSSAAFKIDKIEDWGEGHKQIVMSELNSPTLSSGLKTSSLVHG